MAGPGGIPDADWAKAKAYGQKYGVDPLLLVAIGFQETNWGKAGLGRQGLILGVGAYDSGPVYTWRGLDKQLDQGAKILAQHGVHRIEDVRAGKAKFWTPSAGWAEGVSANYNKLLADVKKRGIQIPGTSVTIPGTSGLSSVVDIPSAIAQASNAFLKQFNKMGLELAVLLGGALFIIAGLVVLFREPLAKAAKEGAEIASAK